MDDVQCPECGQRVLSIATRCPRCGHPFESRLWQHPYSAARRRFPLTAILAGAVLVIAAFGVERWLKRPRVRPSATPAPLIVQPPPPPISESAVGAGPPDDSLVPPDSAAPAAAKSGLERDSTPLPQPPPTADSSAPAVGTSRRPVPAVEVSPEGGTGEVRYATAWVNIRSAPDASAAVAGSLAPGDAVTVDTVIQGWSRVSKDGRVRGYVDGDFLSDEPPVPR